MANNNNEKVVFVGNIPYDLNEAQIIEICEQIGPVVSFNQMIDQTTGKPGGYGFCTYKDHETASSAVRNLEGYLVDGRQLRVNWPRKGVSSTATRPVINNGGLGFVGVHPQQQPMRSQQPCSYVPPPPAPVINNVGPGFMGVHPQQRPMNHVQQPCSYVPVPTSAPAPFCYHVDPMAAYLEKTYSKNQLTQVLSQFKLLATQNNDLARQLLISYPALSSAVYQGIGLLGAAGNQVRM